MVKILGQNLTLLMIKHRDVLNEPFQNDSLNEQVDFIKVAYACNQMFQDLTGCF